MRPSELHLERWRLIDRVLGEALQMPPGDRPRFLDEACAGDLELRTSVEELLETDDLADEILGEPASALAAALLSPSFGGSPVAGRMIGPFRLIREIGRGGMGVVYLAEDTRLGREVAVKALPPFLGVGPEARRRFLAEAKAVSALDHPNVATLHETDLTEEGQPYMVFSFYDGETLDERIRRGPLAPDTAVEVARQIASGLAAAHERGIIHRDVKPSNVLLTRNGEVKLLDFGVAKVAGEDLTGDGIPPGTVAYMSPEQARGEPLDARTDLWSLGVVLYEMLTQQRPFQGTEPTVMLRAIVEDVPRAPARELPESLERILGGLLCKDPSDRYESVRQVSADLSALQAGHELSGRAPELPSAWSPRPRSNGGRSRTRRRAAFGVVATLVSTFIAAALLQGRAGPAPVGHIERLAVLPLENLTADSTRQYVVDGIREALIADLSQMGVVDVVSPASVIRVARSEPSLDRMAQRLGVDAVVEGSVLSRGDSLTLNVRLMGLSPERRLWSDTYTGDLGAGPEITARIARGLGATLDVGVTPAAGTPTTAGRRVDPQAYDAYLQGRFNMSRGNAEGFALAERYFRQAIDVDPDFGLAYVELAEARGRGAFFGIRDPARTLPEVSTLLDHALSLDSTIALAYTRRAHVRLFWNRDLIGAERDARRALELNPSLVSGYFTLSEVMAVQGEYDRALALVERGSELAPWDEFAAVRPALTFYYMRDFDRAIDRIREPVDFFPEFWQAHWILCVSLIGADRAEEALGPCQEAVERSGRTSMAVSSLAYAYAMNGSTDRARTLLEELEGAAEDTYVSPMAVAEAYAGLGDGDQAMAWLDRAYDEHDLRLVQLQNEVFFDGLRSDARFSELVARIGLPAR